MTPKERAAMQQALEALETDEQWGFVNKKVLERRLPAITALREALEQPTIRENLTVQEPVAVVVGQNGGRFVVQPINPAMVLPTDMAVRCQLLNASNREGLYAQALERFAALVATYEREACAKVCEEEAVNVKWNDYIEGCEDCAAAIRARGE